MPVEDNKQLSHTGDNVDFSKEGMYGQAGGLEAGSAFYEVQPFGHPQRKSAEGILVDIAVKPVQVDKEKGFTDQFLFFKIEPVDGLVSFKRQVFIYGWRSFTGDQQGRGERIIGQTYGVIILF